MRRFKKIVSFLAILFMAILAGIGITMSGGVPLKFHSNKPKKQLAQIEMVEEDE